MSLWMAAIVVWPKALSRLREEAAHLRRRKHRMELLAVDGKRINYHMGAFPLAHAQAEGRIEGLEMALQIIRSASLTDQRPLEPVIELAQQGLSPEAIANRCGISVEQVAELLVRFAESTRDEGGSS